MNKAINIMHLPPNAAESFKPTAGVVCPNCWQPMHDFAMHGPSRSLYGLTVRGYLGHCIRCATDCEVLQYESAASGVWPIIGYRLNKGPWVELYDPVPAAAKAAAAIPPVVTGPGGEYRRAYTPNEASPIRPALLKIEEIVRTLHNAIRELIKIDDPSNG